MKKNLTYAIITLFILISLGCKGENNMAHIAEEKESALIATNVTDSTPSYDENTSYNDGTIVQDGDYLYVVGNKTYEEWVDTKEYEAGEIVTIYGNKYRALIDLRFSPETINIALGGSNGLQNTYRWFLTYGDDLWDGDGSVIYYKVPGALNGNTYTFTLQSSQSEIYDVNIASDGGGSTNEVWTVKNSFETTHAVGAYFGHNGKLYEVLSDNNSYVSPDSTSLVAYDVPWEEFKTEINEITEIGAINQLKPFDDTNITPAISSSPMTYTIKGTEEFNSFTLAKVLASSITYTFRNSLNAEIKTETIAIDCKRDPDGILSLYPTTVTYYADTQMEANSTVEITLTHSDDIELGDFTLNNSIDSGFTNLTFSHGIKDHNDYTPDAWGQVSESVKAIVTKFDVTMDVKLTNYDYMVSYLESIAGKNVTIDASDSNGEVANGSTIFASLTRRVRVVSPNIASKVKDNDIDPMATLKFKVEEIV